MSGQVDSADAVVQVVGDVKSAAIDGRAPGSVEVRLRRRPIRKRRGTVAGHRVDQIAGRAAGTDRVDPPDPVVEAIGDVQVGRRLPIDGDAVGKISGAGSSTVASEILGLQGSLARLGCAGSGQAQRQQRSRPGLQHAGPQAMEGVGRFLENPIRMIAAVDRGPTYHQCDQRASPAVAVAFTGGPQDLGFQRAAGALREHERGPRQPGDPPQSECLGAFGGFLDVEDPLQIAAQEGRDARPQSGCGRQGRGRVAAVSRGTQLAARLVQLSRQQADDADRELAGRFGQLRGLLLGCQRIVRDGLAEQAGPIGARHWRRFEPAGQRLALQRADQAGVARSEDALGAQVGLDGFAPATLGAVATSAPEHQPRVLAQQRRRQGIDPGIRPFQQLAALVMQQSVDCLPVLAPRVGLDRVREGAASFQQARRFAVSRPGLNLTELVHEDLLEVRAQHLVIAIAAAVIGGIGEDLAALELRQHLLAAGTVKEDVTDGPAQARQHAGTNQEPAQLRRELVQDITCEVLAGQPRPIAERSQDAPAFLRRLAPGGEMEQLQPRGPALRAARQLSELFRW